MKRDSPILMEAIPRLIARLPPSHRKMSALKSQHYRISAGYSGERNVDSYIARAQFPHTTRVFTDIHLKVSSGFSFQIDALIISEKYILIIEVKNLADRVRFIPNPPHLEQILKTGEKVVIDCPIYQIGTNKANLAKWLHTRGFDIPVNGLLVFANQNTKVENPPDFPMIFKRQIPLFLQQMEASIKILSENQVNKIGQIIEQEQQYYNPFPLCSYYDIDPIDLRKGLLCMHCSSVLTKRTRETWHCLLCQKDAKDPYNDGINDWLMLVKRTITNSECRDFLNLKDKHSASYVLNNSSLIRKGRSTATFYISGQMKKK